MKTSKAIFFASLLLLASIATSSAEPVVLKFAYVSPDTEVRWLKVFKAFIDAVNADASNAVKIEGYPNGALGRSLPQQPQMVLDGVADIAVVVGNLSSGRFPDDSLFELPGLTGNLVEATNLYDALLAANAMRGYSDYVVLGAFVNANLNIFSRKPTKTLADLKGQKVRILGPVVGQTAKALGMVPILMPPQEVVEALGRGVIDAAMAEPMALIDFGIDRVTSNDFMLQLGTNTFSMLMSRATFDTLPQPAKDVLTRHGGRELRDIYSKEISAALQESVDRLKSDPKRKSTIPSAAEAEQAERLFAVVRKDWSAKDAASAQLLGKAEQILTGLRANQRSR